MGVRLGSVLPHGPASVLQAVVATYPVLTQHFLQCYPNCVISNNSFHSPRSIVDAEGLFGRPEGGKLKVSEPNMCSYRHKRWVSSGVKGGKQGGRAREGWSRYGVSVLTTGWTDAKGGGHPQVRSGCVKGNLEFLRGCSNGDATHVLHLQGEGGSGLVQNWPPSTPTLMPPSGSHI